MRGLAYLNVVPFQLRASISSVICKHLFFELLLEARVGFILLWFLSKLIYLQRKTSASDATDKSDSGTEITSDGKSDKPEQVETRSSSLVFGYLNLFSDGVHNFTDGMALGSAFLIYGSVGGWSRTMFLLAHELPQEVSTLFPKQT
jgi:zinc transporter ZupT